MALVLLLSAAANPAAPDPCAVAADATGRSTAARDRQAAASYREVGDEEQARGNDGAATFAYQEALRRAPGDARSRAALARLCAESRRRRATPPGPVSGEGGAASPFDEGLRLMDRGDRAGAITAFEAARAAAPDPSAALLEGICEYELGHDDRARTLLAEARARDAQDTESGEDPETAGTAAFFLGMIALRGGEARDASALFATAARLDARLAADATDVARLALRDGRLIVSGVTEVGVDSNVELTPDGSARTDGSADGHEVGAAALFARLASWGAYLRAAAQVRHQVRITAYDLAVLGAALGVRAGRLGRTAAAEYAYDFVLLGGSPFLSAHRLLASGRLPVGPLSLGATYFARLESFRGQSAAGYSGLRQDLESLVEWRPGQRPAFVAGYHLGRDGADDAALAYFEHGPFAGLRLSLPGRARVGLDGRLTFRHYDAVDPDLEIERNDRYFDGALSGETDLSDRWTLRVSGTARRALSDVADFQYTKLTASVGLVYTAGFL